jgi:ribosome-binding factor A
MYVNTCGEQIEREVRTRLDHHLRETAAVVETREIKDSHTPALVLVIRIEFTKDKQLPNVSFFRRRSKSLKSDPTSPQYFFRKASKEELCRTRIRFVKWITFAWINFKIPKT